jgi:hypothetical protein
MSNSVSQNSKAVGRSAASKAQDRYATEILLSAYARVVKDFTRELYQCIATSRNESIVWVVSGLQTSLEEDRESLIKEALLLPNLDIPSETFKKRYAFRVALALLEGASPEEERTIKAEIEAGVKDQIKHAKAMSELLQEEGDNENQDSDQEDSAQDD